MELLCVLTARKAVIQKKAMESVLNACQGSIPQKGRRNAKPAKGESLRIYLVLVYAMIVLKANSKMFEERHRAKIVQLTLIIIKSESSIKNIVHAALLVEPRMEQMDMSTKRHVFAAKAL